MAPGQPAHSEREKRIQNIISYAVDLEVQLSTAFSARTALRTAPPPVHDVHDQISKLPSKHVSAAESRCAEMDNCGASLWNTCTRSQRGLDLANPAELPPILLVSRVFAFLLLDCAYEHGNNAAGNFTRLLKIGIKAAKSCLEAPDHDLALTVLERISSYEERLEKGDARLPSEDVEACGALVAEYYILRTIVAWQKDQAKVAEHMFSKSVNSKRIIDPRTAESLSDVLYEMGKGLVEKMEYQMAITWLDRACGILDRQEPDRLSTDAVELRISILQLTVKALLGINGPEEMARARDLVAQLELEVGGKLIVLLLKLEILSASTDANFDSNAYADILRKMTRTLIMSDNNVKLIVFHIRKLNEKNSRFACKALDELAVLRILPEGPLEKIERILITRLYLIRVERDIQDDLFHLEKLFDSVEQNITEPLSAAACLGAHTLLWTRIEASYAQGKYDVAERWCKLAMRTIFGNSGEVNMARISRKMLLCSIERNDTDTAADIFEEMSTSSAREPMTQFLMYKLALQSGNSGLAAESLHNIAVSTTDDPSLLYACCLEAQSKDNRYQALAALLLVHEKLASGSPSTYNLPSLTRSAINLIVPMVASSKEGSAEIDGLIDKLCMLFEKAAESVRKASTHAKPGETYWSALELDWFSKNSYNIAVKHLCDWNPWNSLRVILSCIMFIDHYPADISHQISEDLALRKMFCEFMGATALLTLARGEDNIENQLQNYLELRKHVNSFDGLLETKMDIMEKVSLGDLVQKLSILLAFDFEAACHLKAWDSLGEIINKAAMCKSMKTYQLMADCLLCTQAPTTVKITSLKKIVNEAWSLEEVDSVRLAKYMRCMFQLALSDNTEVAEQLLDQIQDHTEQTAETEAPYPSGELEWIITSAFNHGIDFYCNEKDAEARNWVHKSVNLAHFHSDGGVLERTLQDKLLKLGFDFPSGSS